MVGAGARPPVVPGSPDRWGVHLLRECFHLGSGGCGQGAQSRQSQKLGTGRAGARRWRVGSRSRRPGTEPALHNASQGCTPRRRQPIQPVAAAAPSPCVTTREAVPRAPSAEGPCPLPPEVAVASARCRASSNNFCCCSRVSPPSALQQGKGTGGWSPARTHRKRRCGAQLAGAGQRCGWAAHRHDGSKAGRQGMCRERAASAGRGRQGTAPKDTYISAQPAAQKTPSRPPHCCPATHAPGNHHCDLLVPLARNRLPRLLPDLRRGQELARGWCFGWVRQGGGGGPPQAAQQPWQPAALTPASCCRRSFSSSIASPMLPSISCLHNAVGG